MANAFTTAFGTGSSSATLPVTISLLEEKNQVIMRVVMVMILRVVMAYLIFVLFLAVQDSSIGDIVSQ